jgi:hypothetical protein
VRFSPDGTLAMDNHGELGRTPAILGSYKLKGRAIIVTVSGGSACPGDDWTWRAGISEDGQLDTVLTEPGAGNCAQPVGTEWTFIRVSPRSAASAGITAEGTAD